MNEKKIRIDILKELLEMFKQAHLNDGEFTSGAAIRMIEKQIRKELAP